MNKYQLEFFKAKPRFLIFCKALQHAVLGFSHWCWDEDLYDISKFSEWLDFLLQTPQVTCLLLSHLFHGPVQQKHLSTGLIPSEVKYINMLIWLNVLQLTPKCVTILSPFDFKRPVVQIFSGRQHIHLIKKKKLKNFLDLSDPVKPKLFPSNYYAITYENKSKQFSWFGLWNLILSIW